MHTAVMGTGGLGSYFGGMLVNAGVDVTFISRGENLEALQSQGLTVRHLNGSQFHTEVRATDDVSQVGPVDLLWFAVKTYDVEAAAEQAKPLIGPSTLVLPLQNGVEEAARIGRVVGHEHVLGGLCSGGATLLSPGVAEAKTPRLVVKFGELSGGSSSRSEDLLGVLSQSGLDAELSADINVEIWQKFIAACMGLGLSALIRTPMGLMLDYPETRALAFGVMDEAAKVGRAEGVNLPEDAAASGFAILEQVARANPDVRGSMYFDLIQGRRLELDAMNGAVVRLGQKHGIPTPYNFVVVAALRPYEAGAPAPTASAS